ncbi:MAG: DUF4388 domain-containing protein [bacterium]
MSLVGNLEDLSLGDILQIISLSQKSGVLVLQSSQGEGRIVFRDGLVQAASVKGQASDLRGILVGGGFIDAVDFETAEALAAARSAPLEETLTRETGVGPERIEALVRESAEAAILEMFVWQRGDFSFDVRTEAHPEDPRLTLSSCLNAQYLAMEGMRLRDERAHEAGRREASSGSMDAAPDGLPGGPDALPVSEPEPEPEPTREALDVVVETVLASQEAREREPGSEPEIAEGARTAAPIDPSWPHGPKGPHPSSETGPPHRPEPAWPRASTAPMQPAVLIDPDVSALEWMKATLQHLFVRVHVFQQAEQGLSRIRQYVVRGERPVVLLSTGTEVDPLSGIRGLPDFVKRLKLQAPGLPIIGVREAGVAPDARPLSGLDAILERPARRCLRGGPESTEEVGARGFSETVAEALAGAGVARSGDSRSMGKRSADKGPRSVGLSEVKETTARLRDASSRGAILPVVLDFAARLFPRVVVLAVRDRQIIPIAGRGVPALERPATALPPIDLESVRDGWIGRVLETRSAARGRPDGEGDRALLAHLGLPETLPAYVGPIESSGAVIALVYGADSGPGGSELPDPSGLEVVLHHAGIALDHAALERALAESEETPDAGRPPESAERPRG